MDKFRNLDLESVLSQVGLRRQHSRSEDMMPMVGLFGVGFLVGAGVALLLAPRSGKEMRTEVVTRLQHVPDMMANIPQKVSQLADQATGAFGTVGDAGKTETRPQARQG